MGVLRANAFPTPNPQFRAKLRICEEGPDCVRKCFRVRGRDDQSGLSIADESTRNGADGIRRDYGYRPQQGLVTHESPRFHELPGRNRGHNGECRR